MYAVRGTMILNDPEPTLLSRSTVNEHPRTQSRQNTHDILCILIIITTTIIPDTLES